MKRITIGMLAAVDSGKTTLTEAMLYKTGKIRKAGRVDHGDSYLDNQAIERERGITIFSKQAEISWSGVSASILDTPGHVDFAAEMERTLAVLDYAVLIIGANDGVKAHTATLWKLLKKHRVPVFVFVNKMDIAASDRAGIKAEIEKGLGSQLTDFTDTGSDEFSDSISLVSESVAELMLSDMSERDRNEAIDLELIRLIREREMFPVYFGSALDFTGVDELLEGLAGYTAPFLGDVRGMPSGKIFKVAYDGSDRITFAKITKGRIKPKQVIQSVSKAGEPYDIKINEIRVYSGEKYEVRQSAEPGDIVALTGFTDSVPGDVIGDEAPEQEEVLQPYMTYNVHAEDPADTHSLIEALKILAAEDPKLEAEWIRESDQIVVRIMGAVQLEVLQRIIKDRFGISCWFDEEKIIYRETMKGTYEGVGHFEPLRHYSEVHLIISPAERGSGITIRSECPLEMLDINWQNLVMSVLERHHLRGPLTGASLTDVDICLAAGRASKRHTEGGDFREAALRAVRQGLMQARAAGDMVLLEPWLNFRVETEVPEIGAIMTDIDNMGGKTDPPEISEDGSVAVLTGSAPAAGLRGYGARLAGSAHGRTEFSCAMGGYDVCRDTEDVMALAAYDPERDVRNPADSVFCSHGSGDIVKWDEVYSYMHIPSVLEARKKHLDIGNGQYTDEMLESEALLEERKQKYRKKLATDKELKDIFERTYGPVKSRMPKRPESDIDDFDDFPEGTEDTSPTQHDVKDNSTGKHSKKVSLDAGDSVTHLFVDGYNLIHAWPELKELAEMDFGSARDRLTDVICNYAGFTGYDTVLVFDAYKVTDGIGSSLNIHGIKVVYTREHETADAYIERETLNLMKRIKVRKAGGHSAERILVVTSDNLEQIVSMGHGALRISSREFIGEIGRVDELIRNM